MGMPIEDAANQAVNDNTIQNYAETRQLEAISEGTRVPAYLEATRNEESMFSPHTEQIGTENNGNFQAFPGYQGFPMQSSVRVPTIDEVAQMAQNQDYRSEHAPVSPKESSQSQLMRAMSDFIKAESEFLRSLRNQNTAEERLRALSNYSWAQGELLQVQQHVLRHEGII